jgi:hypothetical protein
VDEPVVADLVFARTLEISISRLVVSTARGR